MIARLYFGISGTLLVASLTACTHTNGPVAPPQGSAAFPPSGTYLAEGGWLGTFELEIDTQAGSATLAPVRESSAIGDTYSELGLGPAFTEMFGRNFEVVGLRQNGGDVEVDFRITHPFSPAIRPDLAIFNLKAWAVSDRTPTMLGAVQTVPGLVSNADGYGAMWQETASTLPDFTATMVQPYILLREDPGAGPFDFQNPAGYNVFFPGMTSTATLALRLDNSSQIALRIYLTADYGQSAVRATRQTPAYELPQFAGNAAWKVAVTEIDNSLEAGQSGSTATYQVDVWDWKHGAGLGSDVASVTLQVPGVTTSPVTIALTGTGSDPTPLTGQTLILNAASAAQGEYWGLVTVTDQATSGVGLKEDLATPVTLTSYSTYQTFPVSVAVTALPPTAVIARCYGGDMKIGIGDTFDGSGSTPGSAPIATYEWDWNYDGSNFTVDATGVTASHSYTTAATYTVALRATDTNLQSGIATAVITVTGAPVWNATQRLTTNAVYEQYQGQSSNQTRALAQTADGTLHMIYPVVTGTFPSYTFEHYHIQYSGCPATWSAPVLISSTLNTSNFQWNCSLTASGNTLHASYTGPSEPSAYPEFRHATFDGTSWTIVGRLTTYISPGQTWTGGYIATKPDGTVGFAGKRRIAGTCPGIPGPPMPVYFTEWNGTAWSALQQIGDRHIVLSSSACGSFSLSDEDMGFIATADNNWLALWATNEQQYDGFTNLAPSYTVGLRYNRTTGGSAWGTQSYAYNGVNRNPNPMLARSPNGTIWLATGVNPNANIGIGTYNGSTWSPMTTVRTQIGSETFFGYNFAPNGNAMLLYSHNQPSNYINYVAFTESTPVASIGGLPGLAVEPGTFARVSHQVAGLADGRFVAAWQTDKYGGGPFASREIDTATWQ